MDWQTQSEDKLDNLPKRERLLPPDDHEDRYRGMNYPYKRVEKFLESQVGRPIDAVFSDFCHADWIPVEQRTKEQFRKHVELDTFIQDGKVFFYDKYGSDWRGKVHSSPVVNNWNDVLYVNPKNRCLAIFRHKPFDFAKKRKAERDEVMRILGDYHQLNKVEGIWYEVKAEISSTGWLRRRTTDILLGDDQGYSIYTKVPYIRITLKRQLSHDELKKFGLKNTVAEMSARCPKCGGVGKGCIHWVLTKAKKKYGWL